MRLATLLVKSEDTNKIVYAKRVDTLINKGSIEVLNSPKKLT